jgi:hypothetical protein
MLFRAFCFLCLLPAGWAAPAVQPSLLEHAVENWLGERDYWSFTQRAVEYEDGKPRERLERYDPSQAGDARWKLLAIDGRPPTDAERAAWAKKKFKKNRRKFDSPLGEFFAFDRAKVLEDGARLVRYQVPLRTDKSWLFPVDKVVVHVTVNKETQALERLSADVREPFKVLFGIARINDGALDLSFLNFDADAEPGPESAQPSGTARVSVQRFGERVEFTWSEFKRVTPYADPVAKKRD